MLIKLPAQGGYFAQSCRTALPQANQGHLLNRLTRSLVEDMHPGDVGSNVALGRRSLWNIGRSFTGLGLINVTDYCTILLNPATKADILSACIQAEAALRVGHEQAVAARFAGWLTLIAGAGALVAGVLAYYAASMALRQAEGRERRLTTAYRHQLLVQFRYVLYEINDALERLKPNPESIIRAPLDETLSLSSFNGYAKPPFVGRLG